MATDKPMQLGMAGLGRMGPNLARRLRHDGAHRVAHTDDQVLGTKRHVARSPKASSSSGTGACRASTGLDESAMTTKRSAATAWISSA
jgi:6-phosphogluconate dehydrogenase (decarboxylating)